MQATKRSVTGIHVLSRQNPSRALRRSSNRKHLQSGRRKPLLPTTGTLTIPSHSITLLTLPFTSRTAFRGDTPINLHNTATILYSLCKAYKGFIDKDWIGTETVQDVIAFLLESLEQVRPDDLLCIEYNTTIEIRFLSIAQQCHEHGAMLDIQVIDDIKKTNKRAYALFMEFLKFSLSYLHITDFNDDTVDMIHESILDDIEQSGDQEYIDDEQELIEYLNQTYKLKLPRLYNQIMAIPGTPETFKANLLDYHPKQKAYQQMKEWFLKGYDIYERGFDMDKHANPYHHIPTESLNCEVLPDQYIRFIWSYNDRVGEWISHEYSERMGNDNCIPLMDSIVLTEDTINDLLQPKDSIIDEFYAWFSDGQAIYDLEQHFRTRKQQSNDNN